MSELACELAMVSKLESVCELEQTYWSAQAFVVQQAQQWRRQQHWWSVSLQIPWISE